MKISIITPTNVRRSDSAMWQYFMECADSVLAQSHEDWEWIVLSNGGAALVGMPKDPRIRVIKTQTTGNIGALKKEACRWATGDVIVELDHDDILTRNCLMEVARAFEEDPEVLFVYSNCAEFFFGHAEHADYEANLYNSYWGWKYRDFFYDGIQYKELIAFDPSPASLSVIWYAPNHVRAWRRDDYYRIGGHNPDLKVVDDHDLVVRFYLAGKIKKIDKCLYLYRIHGRNSWLQNNAEIQEKTLEMRRKYIWRLCERFCQLNDWPMLDLGGAFYPPEGYETVDIIGDVDHHMDLNRSTWTFPDNSYGLVRAFDTLEHLKDPINTMNNIHRILKPGGLMISATPSTDGRGAFSDPTHVSFWNQESFKYYTHPVKAQYIPACGARFQAIRMETYFPSEQAERDNVCYTYFDGIAVKKGMPRYPGPMDWAEEWLCP